MPTNVSNKKSGYLFPLIAISFLLLGAIPSLALIINTNPSGATVAFSGQSPGATQYSTTPAVYPPQASLRLTKWSYIPSSYNTKLLPGTTTPQSLADNPPSVLATSSPISPTTASIVTITASATDDKGLSSITVYADGVAKKTCKVSRVSKNCSYASTFSAGTHSYYATARDNAGQTSTSAQRSFTVSTPAPAPQPTPIYQSITTGNPTYDKYDNLIIKYSTKYNMPDPMIIKAQIYQESYFDDMGVNPENACGVSTINGKPIDKSYTGVDNMVNPAWSLGSMQESRSCVNSFLTNADGSFNNTLWHDSNYKFDFYLNDWMNNANGPGNPSFNNFKQRFPGCNVGKLTLMAVALWNNGNDYNSCNDPINNLNGYTSDVLSHYYEMAKMANYIPLYAYNTIL